MSKSDTAETVYERIAHLEDEVASLRNELDFLKNAMRNKIARHEIKMIRKGTDVSSMID
jgi:cell division protein FtsB